MLSALWQLKPFDGVNQLQITVCEEVGRTSLLLHCHVRTPHHEPPTSVRAVAVIAALCVCEYVESSAMHCGTHAYCSVLILILCYVHCAHQDLDDPTKLCGATPAQVAEARKILGYVLQYPDFKSGMLLHTFRRIKSLALFILGAVMRVKGSSSLSAIDRKSVV